MDAGPGQPVPVAAPQAPARSGLQMREHSEWRAEAAREAARQVAEDAARAEAEQRSRAAEWRSRDPERDQALRVTGGALVREMSAQVGPGFLRSSLRESVCCVLCFVYCVCCLCVLSSVSVCVCVFRVCAWRDQVRETARVWCKLYGGGGICV